MLKKVISVKVCPKCGKEKPITMEFWYRSLKTQMIRPFCKICDQIYRTPLADVKNADDPRADLLSQVQKRAKVKGLEINISKEDLIIPGICPILKIPIKRTLGQATDGSPSVDRIDPHKGYIKGNVQVISMRANTLKNNATVQELEAILEFIKTIK